MFSKAAGEVAPPRQGKKNAYDIAPVVCLPQQVRQPADRSIDSMHSGVIINQSELAHYGQISTPRMSQIMWLDNLAPDIQDAILALPRTVQGRDAILEREVRPIAKTHDWAEQRKMWTETLNRVESHSSTKPI